MMNSVRPYRWDVFVEHDFEMQASIFIKNGKDLHLCRFYVLSKEKIKAGYITQFENGKLYVSPKQKCSTQKATALKIANE